MRRTWREATIFRGSRTKSHAYSDLSDDRLLGPAHTNVEAHTDARSVWRLSLHGRRFVEGTTIFRQDFNHANACQVPTRLHVPPAGKQIEYQLLVVYPTLILSLHDPISFRYH